MDGVQWEMRQEAGKDQFKGGWVAKLRKFGILSDNIMGWKDFKQRSDRI